MRAAPPPTRTSIALVGPLDVPIGGVSSHVRRLADMLAEHEIPFTIIDAYPSVGKKPASTLDHEVTPFTGALTSTIWAIWRVLRCNRNAVHLHFSQIVGKFMLTALLLWPSRKRIIVTLHHGDQKGVYNEAGWFLQGLSRFALSRAHKIVALSDEQAAFYLSLGMPQARICRWRSMPPLDVAPDASLLATHLQGLTSVESGGDETILVTSGYPTNSYRYDLSISLLNEVARNNPCRLIICIYGTDKSDDEFGEILKVCGDRPDISIVGPLPQAGFLALLQKASLYLRPSDIDSYGLAITDALNMGTPCLASDVCARDPRCATFPAGDIDSFTSEGLRLVAIGRAAGAKSVVDSAPRFDESAILETYNIPDGELAR